MNDVYIDGLTPRRLNADGNDYETGLPVAEVERLMQEARELNNQGQQLIRQRKYDEAIRAIQASIAIKVRHFGGLDTTTAAIGYQGLGDAYLGAGKLDEAKGELDRAYRVRCTLDKGPQLDKAVTRESLGLYWEAKGDGAEAKAIRIESPDEILCAHESCRGPLLKCSTKTAKGCSGCGCVYYCGLSCQKGDWKRHKGFCTEASGLEKC